MLLIHGFGENTVESRVWRLGVGDVPVRVMAYLFKVDNVYKYYIYE